LANWSHALSRDARSRWQFTLGAWAIGLILIVLEWAWFAWFLAEPLPNTGRVGGPPLSIVHLTRGLLLWRAVPGVIPGLPASQTLLYQAARELRHVENLPQRGPIVLAALLIAAASVGLGQLVLRALGLRRELSAWEHVPLSFGLGAVGLGLITLILGRLGALAPWPTRIGLGLLLVGGWLRKRGNSIPKPYPLCPFPLSPILFIAGPFLVIMMLGAMLPTYDYDAIEYHLEGPKEYFQNGQITFLPHNVYTSMPFGIEMLHLLGMEVVGDWWWGALVGQLLVAFFAPMAGALIALSARRWGSPRAGWIAAVVYLSTPWIYRVGVFPYVEGPLCYFHAALIYASGRAWEVEPKHRGRFWALAGLLAGGAMTCKYTALVSAVIPFGLLAVAATWKQRSPTIVLTFSAGVAMTIGPWLVKNVIDTGNPVYPLAYRVFGGRHWDPVLNAKWEAAHGPRTDRSARALIDSLLDVTGRSDWQSPLFVALAPLAIVRRGPRRFALLLMGYAAYIFLTWWLLTHRLDRFWLPLLPVAAILAGLGADWTGHRGWLALLAFILGFGIVANFVFCTTALAGFNQWTGDLLDLRTRVPRDLNPALAQLDADLPPGTKVLLIGQAAVFHFRHPVVYNTVFNHETIETLARNRPPDQVHRDLRRLGIDCLYVDWNEIARFRAPGNYGFTDFVTPEVFAKLVAAGVLDPAVKLGYQQEVYWVRDIASEPKPQARSEADPK
jgi:hypothetical protein